MLPGFSLMLIIKMKEERDKLRKDLLKKEPAFDDLENSQPI